MVCGVSGGSSFQIMLGICLCGFGRGCCCLSVMVAEYEVSCEVFLVELNLLELIIGQAYIYRVHYLDLTWGSPFAASDCIKFDVTSR
ncbi:hypothetical protein F2Q69_00015499 [Brassica cretica]|uniref:Uncharacterized protein n=1 Tax=Brassica cretica TaxID=69181 RepID=A0A8S9R8J9_BRACR|nr:hypothetical protein F2Q69_00015499 [Brassica cretica]